MSQANTSASDNITMAKPHSSLQTMDTIPYGSVVSMS